jgi:hypothetical protein
MRFYCIHVGSRNAYIKKSVEIYLPPSHEFTPRHFNTLICPPCLMTHHPSMAYGGAKVERSSFFVSARDWGYWSASFYSSFNRGRVLLMHSGFANSREWMLCRVISNPASCAGGPGFTSSHGDRLFWGWPWFSSVSQANNRRILQISLRSLPYHYLNSIFTNHFGARGSVVGWGYATSRKVAASSPDEVIGFYQLT